MVVALIAFRQVGSVRVGMWQAMVLGALAMLVTGQVSLTSALHAVNLDVIAFLFGMFVVARAVDESGYLASASARLLQRARRQDLLVGIVLVASAVGAAVLMNDTVAILGTPVVIMAARRSGFGATPLLFALAFGVTIGGAMSPIGNPQNLLVATVGGVGNPFIAFARHLVLPSMVNLGIAFVTLRLVFRREMALAVHAPTNVRTTDRELATASLIAIGLVLVLIVLRVVLALTDVGAESLRLSYIALVGALPVVLLSGRRVEMICGIDWRTLAFFVGMFILMEAVWETGFFQGVIDGSGLNVTSVPVVLGVSVTLSQLMSNVPLVALYLPGLVHAGVGEPELLALAAGASISGNLTIIGAASNVIIIQQADRSGAGSISFWRFLAIGAPLTVVNVVVYWVFLTFV